MSTPISDYDKEALEKSMPDPSALPKTQEALSKLGAGQPYNSKVTYPQEADI